MPYLVALRPLAPYLLLLAVSLAVHWTSLLEAGRPFYVDSNLPLTYDDFHQRYFYTWNANNGHLNFGQFMRIPYIAPLYAVFRGLGIAVNDFVTVLFWLPTYLGMVAAYVFFGAVLGDRQRSRRLVVVCLLLAVFYGLSPWILKHYLHYFFRVSYAVLPLAFLGFVRYVHAGRRRDLVLTGLAVVFLGTNPHFLVYFAILAGLFALVEGVLSGRLGTVLGRTVAAGAVAVVFSLFWLLPFVASTVLGESVVGYNVGERMVSLLSERSGPLNLLSLMAGFWPAVLERSWWLFEPMWAYQTVFLAVPIAAVAGFLAADRDDRFALFAGVGVVAITALATGYKYGWPMSRVYDVILQLPFHGVMRAPARLQAIVPLLLGYLIGRAALDGDRPLLRGGAVVLLGVACLGALAMSVPVFGQALAPTELPADHESVEAADYEDAFVSPPRPLGGYNPDWMFAREGGVVDSWDTHLFARPDTRQHYLNYYVLELIDRDQTATAIDVLRKTGANHFVVRTDAKNRRGVPQSEVLVERLGEHLPQVDGGPNLAVFRIAEPDATDPFSVVRPVEAPRDLHATAAFASQPAVHPTFDTDVPADPMRAELDATRRFHPANTFRRINEMDSLSRPPTDQGVIVRGERTLTLPDRNGSLQVRATPLNRGAEIVRETETGREIFKLRDGLAQLRLPLDGRQLTIRGPVSVERLAVSSEPARRAEFPVETGFHAAGTLTPDRTEVATERATGGVNLTYEVASDGVFPQASFEPASSLDGPFTVRTAISAADGGDRVGLVLLRENRSAVLYPTQEHLRPGRQNLTVHVPNVPNSSVSRLQVAIFPAERPVADNVTIHDVGLSDGAPSPLVAQDHTGCDEDPTRARCEDAATVTAVERVSPTRFEVTVDASAPYVLHFGEAYDALWTAEVDGENGTESYGSQPLSLATNGFRIDETGQHTVTVRYRPERWFHVGIALSGVAVLVGLGYLFFDWRRRRGGPRTSGAGPLSAVRERLAAARRRLRGWRDGSAGSGPGSGGSGNGGRGNDGHGRDRL